MPREIEAAERIAELNFRALHAVDPDQAQAYQENCQRLIGLASGAIRPNVRKLMLVNGRPAPTEKEREMPPAA
ncbi:hypothetical protein KW797_01435 [Candidatus Parcubacteria bacterium]|nr:hypothetical protein [Candidatus Parcubacteria bacterium]